MKNYILSIDQGTTGTTALIIEAKTFTLINKVNIEHPQIYPTPGQVEHNLNDIWSSVKKSITAVLLKSNITSSEIKSIGITNQRETTCAYDNDGSPLANAIVWQDRRTSSFCKEHNSEYQKLKKLTGLPLDPYFSATKMNWLLRNNSRVKDAAENKNLKLSTIDTFLLFKMTNGKSFYTEPSNASRTLLMDLDSCHWNTSLLNFFDIKKEFLPEIKDSFTSFGITEGLDFLPDGIPITCILGDQQAALFGQAGFNKGDLKCTYGTGAFILLNTGVDKVYSDHGLLTTVAFKLGNNTCYALEGSCYIAGAAVQWLRDNLNIIKNSHDIEDLASLVKDMTEMEHLLFMPFFTGIGSPYWNAEAKGAILGLTRDTANKHLARACLDGMALSINDSITAIVSDSGQEVTQIKVDGGASQNDLLMKIQASFSNKTIIRPKVIETTGYGVALGSLVGLGEIGLSDLTKFWMEDKRFDPASEPYYQSKKAQWQDYFKKLYL